MTFECPWAERVAIAVDHPALPVQLAEHLSHCNSCSQLLADLKADRELIANGPTISDEDLNELRSGVHRRLALQSRRQWQIAAVFAAAAALVLVVLKLNVSVPEPAPVAYVRPGQVSVPAFKPDAGEHVVSTSPVVHRRAHRRSGPPRTEAAFINGQIVVKKQTADPNVVILLVGDTETGGADE